MERANDLIRSALRCVVAISRIDEVEVGSDSSRLRVPPVLSMRRCGLVVVMMVGGGGDGDGGLRVVGDCGGVGRPKWPPS